jgi:hypothetical protein
LSRRRGEVAEPTWMSMLMLIVARGK